MYDRQPTFNSLMLLTIHPPPAHLPHFFPFLHPSPYPPPSPQLVGYFPFERVTWCFDTNERLFPFALVHLSLLPPGVSGWTPMLFPSYFYYFSPFFFSPFSGACSTIIPRPPLASSPSSPRPNRLTSRLYLVYPCQTIIYRISPRCFAPKYCPTCKQAVPYFCLFPGLSSSAPSPLHVSCFLMLTEH